MRTSLEFLGRVEPPWIHVGPPEPGRDEFVAAWFYGSPGADVCVRRLRGWKMRTLQALMDEFGAALQLFDAFGENWYALEESLCYLDEWLPGDAYVLVVDRAEQMLADQPDQRPALFTTLDNAGRFWSEPVADGDRFDRPAKPFHVVLNTWDDSGGRLVSAASDAGVAVRTPPA